MTLTTSSLDPKNAVLDLTVLAGDPWIGALMGSFYALTPKLLAGLVAAT